MTTGSDGAVKPGETGGTNGSGSGGATAQGGSGQSGGAVGSGGTSGTAGASGSGGAPATGGHGSTGGADASTDGPSTGTDATTMDVHGTGGNGSGGAATGGSGTGGRGTGGANTGGAATGGAATGGAATGGAATGGAATGGAATGGAATGGAGTGGAATGGAGTGGAGTGGAAARCHIVVNEIQTGTAQGLSDEFVELFNTCSDSQDLAGHSLNYRSAGNNSGAADSTLYVFPNDSKIPGHGYVIVVGITFPGTGGPHFVSGGLAAMGGAVALRNPGGVIVDGVSYDTLTATNIFTEGYPAVNPPMASSIARVPDGADTDNNARDFSVSVVASPGASN